jgi:hypothetical protein
LLFLLLRRSPSTTRPPGVVSSFEKYNNMPGDTGYAADL